MYYILYIIYYIKEPCSKPNFVKAFRSLVSDHTKDANYRPNE